MGMMLSLGAMWLLTELLHREKNHEEKSHLSVIGVLRKIDTASVLFFLGILLALPRFKKQVTYCCGFSESSTKHLP